MSSNATNIINVVIDERKQLENVDSAILMQAGRRFAHTGASRSNVFKHYITSSELFLIDSTVD